MDGSQGYALEKLTAAIHTLATGPEDVRARLSNAFMSFHTLRQEDFPDHLQADWQWIYEQLTRFGPVLNYKGEVSTGSVDHTMSRIKNATGVKIAKRILHLYYELESHLRVRR